MNLQAEAIPAPQAAALPPSVRVGGHARWTVEQVDGCSASTGAAASYPLSLLVPQARGVACWGFLANHGGGLVAGDAITIATRIGPGAAAYLGTQSVGKVYRSDDHQVSRQQGHHQVGRGGFLAYLPDPVCCYAQSRYAQDTHYELDAGASLVACDSLLSGRQARGESWNFSQYQSRTRLTIAGRTVAIDAITLDGPRLARRMACWQAYASLIAIGPWCAAFNAGVEALLGLSSATPPFLASSAPCGDGRLVRLACRTPAQLTLLMQRLCATLERVCGGAPWLRRP